MNKAKKTLVVLLLVDFLISGTVAVVNSKGAKGIDSISIKFGPKEE